MALSRVGVAIVAVLLAGMTVPAHASPPPSPSTVSSPDVEIVALSDGSTSAEVPIDGMLHVLDILVECAPDGSICVAAIAGTVPICIYEDFWGRCQLDGYLHVVEGWVRARDGVAAVGDWQGVFPVTAFCGVPLCIGTPVPFSVPCFDEVDGYWSPCFWQWSASANCVPTSSSIEAHGVLGGTAYASVTDLCSGATMAGGGL